MAVTQPSTPMEQLLLNRLEAAEAKINAAEAWATTAKNTIEALTQSNVDAQQRVNKVDGDMTMFANKVEEALFKGRNLKPGERD